MKEVEFSILIEKLLLDNEYTEIHLLITNEIKNQEDSLQNNNFLAELHFLNAKTFYLEKNSMKV